MPGCWLPTCRSANAIAALLARTRRLSADHSNRLSSQTAAPGLLPTAPRRWRATTMGAPLDRCHRSAQGPGDRLRAWSQAAPHPRCRASRCRSVFQVDRKTANLQRERSPSHGRTHPLQHSEESPFDCWHCGSDGCHDRPQAFPLIIPGIRSRTSRHFSSAIPMRPWRHHPLRCSVTSTPRT